MQNNLFARESPTKPYVLGLLATARAAHDAASSTWQAAMQHMPTTTQEIQHLGAALQSIEQSMQQERTVGNRAMREIAAQRDQLHAMAYTAQNIDRRINELRQAASASTDEEIQKTLRRSRAVLQVQLNGHKKNIEQKKAAISKGQQVLETSQQAQLLKRQQFFKTRNMLHQCIARLPPPALYTRMFELEISCANAVLCLDRHVPAWHASTAKACDYMVQWHAALEAGYYRLDEGSPWVAGRARATGDALALLVVLGRPQLALQLFKSAMYQDTFFHHIPNVLYALCLGLYLDGQHAALLRLTQLHAFDDGLQGLYAQLYVALLQNDAVSLCYLLPTFVDLSWRAHQKKSQHVLLGIINIHALALCVFAQQQNIVLPNLGPLAPLDCIA